jgi:hypothetical protein
MSSVVSKFSLFCFEFFSIIAIPESAIPNRVIAPVTNELLPRNIAYRLSLPERRISHGKPSTAR